MVKNTQSNLIASVKMLNIGVMNECTHPNPNRDKLTANQLTANKLTANKLTANNVDWLRRAILNIFLLSPEPSCPNLHFVTKSLR